MNATQIKSSAEEARGRRIGIDAIPQSVSSLSGLELRPLHVAAIDPGEVPERVLLAPWGDVESDSGTFIVDEESATLAAQAFDEHGTDLPIDYEHQTLGGAYASPNGKAPAAGWIKGIFAEPGAGLLAQIEWTEAARQLLVGKEYRYLSPVAIIRKSDRKLVAIHSAALTNKPAIVGMTPIVNREVMAFEQSSESLAALRTALELPDDSDAAEVLVAASRRLTELREIAKVRHVAERIREAMRSGKLIEAQRAWAEALVAKEEGIFDEWLRTAPVIVRPGVIAAPHTSDGGVPRNQAAALRARAEFRSNPILAQLTNEEAYVGDVLRQVES